jgi:hypothetical protein
VNSNTIRHQLRHVATMTEPPLRTFGDALADENLCRRPARFIAESNMARPDNLPDRRLVTGSCAMIRWTIINVESSGCRNWDDTVAMADDEPRTLPLS